MPEDEDENTKETKRTATFATRTNPHVVEDDKGVRYLRLTPDSCNQSAYDTRSPHRLVFEYMKAVVAACAAVPDPRRILLIGLGGGTLAMFLRRKLPDARIDIIEIDYRVAKLAKEAMGFKPDENMRVIYADAARELDPMHYGRTREHYDLIVIDAYGPMAPAEAIATGKFYRSCRAHTAQGGAVICHLWSTYCNPDFERMKHAFNDTFLETRCLRPKGASRVLVGFPEVQDAYLPPPHRPRDALWFVPRFDALRERWKLRFDAVKTMEWR